MPLGSGPNGEWVEGGCCGRVVCALHKRSVQDVGYHGRGRDNGGQLGKASGSIIAAALRIYCVVPGADVCR